MTEHMSPVEVARAVTDMKWLNADGIAARIKHTSFDFVCTSLASEGIPAAAEFEHIHIRILKFALRQPQHFTTDFLYD